MTILAMLVSLFFWRAPSAPGQTSQPTYPETDEGLASLMKDMMVAAEAKDREKLIALIGGMRLPNHRQWFDDIFGQENGPKLADEYEQVLKGFEPNLAKLFLSLSSPTQLQIETSHVETPDDPRAKGYQLFALNAMKNRTALYTAKVFRPGTNASITLWSIVYADGGFRFVGKMKAAKD
jgi:hypothetical protein